MANKKKIKAPRITTRVNQTIIQAWIENDLVKKLDAYARKLEKEQPGTRIGRATAVRIILHKALEAS